MLAAVVATAAWSAPAGGHSMAVRSRSRSAVCMDQPDELSVAFADEVRRRQQSGLAPEAGSAGEPQEPFTGIREIVLRDGAPVSIPRRPPPPPASTMGDEVSNLLQNPGFLFGCLVSAASLALFLAISAADAGAS